MTEPPSGGGNDAAAPAEPAAASVTAVTTGPDYISYICLALMAVSFGSTFLFQSIALQGMSALEAGSFRIIFGAAFLLPAAFIAGQPLLRTVRLWSWAAFNGLVGFFIPFNLTMWALIYVPTRIAAAIYSVIPLIVLGLSRLFLGVHISGVNGLGCCLAPLAWRCRRLSVIRTRKCCKVTCWPNLPYWCRP